MKFIKAFCSLRFSLFAGSWLKQAFTVLQQKSPAFCAELLFTL